MDEEQEALFDRVEERVRRLERETRKFLYTLQVSA